MIGDRGKLKSFVFDEDGCKAKGEPKTFCQTCIFKTNCPKEKINKEEEMTKGTLRVYDYCPKCDIRIYHDKGIYRCPVHGDFVRNFITGELDEKVREEIKETKT